MREASGDAVPLPAALSAHVLVVLEYLHGKFALPEDPDPELVVGVYELSRQFQLGDLEEEVLGVLPGLCCNANIGSFLELADQVGFTFPLCLYDIMPVTLPLSLSYIFIALDAQVAAPEVEELALNFCSTMPIAKDMFVHFSQQKALVK